MGALRLPESGQRSRAARLKRPGRPRFTGTSTESMAPTPHCDPTGRAQIACSSRLVLSRPTPAVLFSARLRLRLRLWTSGPFFSFGLLRFFHYRASGSGGCRWWRRSRQRGSAPRFLASRLYLGLSIDLCVDQGSILRARRSLGSENPCCCK
ncbi:hypothetical protein B0T22DRAFT_39191 [Podospora appendiculata]|uniref:Uncharacterized protein n=1 Tax=Podospora appendiculata TaxID=314037 RepID=A0AAE0XH79_9PEZI|nr:hypothetical protein B0T22DRAFT_39191 [Podospora appendiculata]